MTVTDWVSAEHGPPQWIPRDGALSVNRYADVAALLRHPDIRVPELGRNIAKLGERANRSFPNLVNLVGGWLLFQNPPIHPRLRQFLRQTLDLVGPAFSAETVRAQVRSLLDELPCGEPVDAVRSITNRLPIRVMANALGIPEEYVTGTRETNYRLNQVWHYAAPLRTLERLEIEAGRVFGPLIEMLRAGPGPRIGLSEIAALGKGELGLTEDEIAASIFFLIVAGIVTTCGMLSTMLLLVLTHPAQPAWWRGTPQAVKSGLDEIARMGTPLRQLVRIAGADVTLDDTRIERGTSLILKVEEAHRDPAAYPNPGQFNPARRGPAHLAFSAGAHACLGAAIAYREAALLLDELFARFDIALLDDTPHWEEHRDFRRLERLSLILQPSKGGLAI